MLVTFTRGEHPESHHQVVWCLVAPDGEVLAESAPGDAARPVFPRSALKPFQALPAARAGVLERFGLDHRHLALACASHGGGEEHLALVREILSAAGLSEADLGLGALEPRDPSVRADPAPVVHNCSGKHALGLALCVAEGWPLEGYMEHGHPLQDAMCAATAELTGTPGPAIGHASDGCGMSTLQVPLGALALGFGRLGAERPGAAMREHPPLVAFHGAVDTEIMGAAPGLVAKVGAEGVLAIGAPDGRGLALKVLDGAMRAIDPAGVALAREHLGLRVPLERLARPPVMSSLGQVVGNGMVEPGP